MPTKTNAQNAEMDFDTFYKRTVRALDIDYKELKKECEKKIESFQGKSDNEVHYNMMMGLTDVCNNES